MRKFNFEARDKSNECEPESVLESEDYKILWGFSIQTNHVIEASRLRIEEREKEKTEKYQDLESELQKIWSMRVKIISLAVGSVGVVPKQFGNRLKDTGIKAEIGQVEKSLLLGTARILRKILEI